MIEEKERDKKVSNMRQANFTYLTAAAVQTKEGSSLYQQWIKDNMRELNKDVKVETLFSKAKKIKEGKNGL